MHQERDAIRDRVSPIVNAAARLHGDSVDFVDFRWGINTENLDEATSSNKILNVCFNEIYRCEPPMILLIGDRYGWIPDEKDILKILSQKKIDIDYRNKSVTELEIEYGAFVLKRPVFVYLKTVEYENSFSHGKTVIENKEKLDLLKARLSNIKNATIKNYTVHVTPSNNPSGYSIPDSEIDSFSKMVADDIIRFYKNDWEKDDRLPFIDRELKQYWSFVNNKNEQFKARENESTQII